MELNHNGVIAFLFLQIRVIVNRLVTKPFATLWEENYQNFSFYLTNSLNFNVEFQTLMSASLIQDDIK